MITVEAIRGGLACAVQLSPGPIQEGYRTTQASACKATAM